MRQAKLELNGTAVRVNAPVETVPYLQTVIPDNRRRYLRALCDQVLSSRPGPIIEVGVYRGGTLLELARSVKEHAPAYKVHAFDTFSGHPYTDGHPVHPTGKYSDVCLDTLWKHLQDEGVAPWIELHRGLVEETLLTAGVRDITFAHIDCDLYVPTRFCADQIPPLADDEATLYFDDYGHEHCPGATTAVLEVFSPDLLEEVYLPEDSTCWSAHLSLSGNS